MKLIGYNYSFDLFNESVLNNFLDEEIFCIEKPWDRACIFKYQYLLDQLNSCEEDYLVYVEYDACFCNTIKKLEDYIDDEHDIFYSRCNWSWDVNNYLKNVNTMVQEINKNLNDICNYETCSKTFFNNINSYLTIAHNIFFCNEGFYILKNSEITKEFLRAIVKYAPCFSNCYSWIPEGMTLQFMMASPKFNSALQVLPPKTQGHIYGNSNAYDEDECLICHNSSIEKEKLYNFLTTIRNNKYFKNKIVESNE